MDNEQLLQVMSNLLDEKFDEKLKPINSRLDNMESRLDNMDSRLEKLESDVSALRVGQVDIRKELKKVKHKVSDTYDLALDAWGTSTENRNWIQSDKLKA